MPPFPKRRKLDQPTEITFDPAARQDYLSGFHKRKEQRKQTAKEAAIKREKEERLVARKQVSTFVVVMEGRHGMLTGTGTDT